MDSLAKTEYVANKISAIHSVTVKGYFCVTCNLTTESAVSLCTTKKHQVKNISLVKRFFECSHCRRRDAVIGTQKVPTGVCICGKGAWAACGKFGSNTASKDVCERLISTDHERRLLSTKRGDMDSGGNVGVLF